MECEEPDLSDTICADELPNHSPQLEEDHYQSTMLISNNAGNFH